MRSVTAKSYGTPDTLEITTSPIPTLISNQILVKVKFSSLNPIDYKILSGSMKLGFKSKFPYVPGADFCGVIEQIEGPSDVFSVGDMVFGFLSPTSGRGTHSDYIVVNPKTDGIAKVPPSVAHEVAAAIPLTGLTCLKMIDKSKFSGLTKSAIVFGASGGVGSLLIQLLRSISPDCHITAVCSSRNSDLVSSFGASSIADYTSNTPLANQLIEKLPSGVQEYDCAFDCVGGDDLYEAAVPALKKGAIYATIVGPTAHGSKLTFTSILSAVGTIICRSLFSKVSYKVILEELENKRCEELVSMVEKAKVHFPITKYKLEDAGKAYEELAGHRVTGKIILTRD